MIKYLSIRNRAALCGGVWLMLLLLSTTGTMGQETLSKIVERGEIVIATTGDQPPFSITKKDGSLIGYDVDLAKTLAQTMNVALRLEKMPFAELLPALQAGTVDAVLSGMTITAERNLEVAFVGPYVLSGKSILTKSTALAKAKSAADMNSPNVKLAALAGSTSAVFVQQQVSNARLTTVTDYEEGIKLVAENKVSALVADFPVLALTQMRFPKYEVIGLEQPLTIEPIGMALPANDPLLINLIQNYFKGLMASGYLSELQHQWFNDGAWMIEMEEEPK